MGGGTREREGETMELREGAGEGGENEKRLPIG